jgi:hypothetical protein
MVIKGSLVHSLNLLKYDNEMPKKGSGLLLDIVKHEHFGISFS